MRTAAGSVQPAAPFGGPRRWTRGGGGRALGPEAMMGDPGRLAQLGEHQLDKLGVTGSSPVPPTLHRKPAFAGFSLHRSLRFESFESPLACEARSLCL